MVCLTDGKFSEEYFNYLKAKLDLSGKPMSDHDSFRWLLDQ